MFHYLYHWHILSQKTNQIISTYIAWGTSCTNVPELFEYYVSLTDYTRCFSAHTYTVKRYFVRKEATFCGFAIGNWLPRWRVIPVLSNNTESADLPASRSDKQWNTWYRYIYGMISGVSYRSNSSVRVPSCVLCVSVDRLCFLLTRKRLE